MAEGLKFSYLSLSTLVHVGIAAAIGVGTYELVTRSDPARIQPSTTLTLLSTPGHEGGSDGLRGGAADRGPVIKTPVVKIPKYTYEAPTESDPVQEAPPSRPRTATQTNPTKPHPATKPAANAAQARPATEKPTPANTTGTPAASKPPRTAGQGRPQYIKAPTRDELLGLGTGASSGSRGSGRATALEGGGGFESVLLGRIQALLAPYRAGRSELTAKVQFVMSADGRCLNPTLVAGSGDPGFDEAVMHSLRQVAMEETPPEFVGRAYSVSVKSAE